MKNDVLRRVAMDMMKAASCDVTKVTPRFTQFVKNNHAVGALEADCLSIVREIANHGTVETLAAGYLNLVRIYAGLVVNKPVGETPGLSVSHIPIVEESIGAPTIQEVFPIIDEPVSPPIPFTTNGNGKHSNGGNGSRHTEEERKAAERFAARFTVATQIVAVSAFDFLVDDIPIGNLSWGELPRLADKYERKTTESATTAILLRELIGYAVVHDHSTKVRDVINEAQMQKLQDIARVKAKQFVESVSAMI